MKIIAVILFLTAIGAQAQTVKPCISHGNATDCPEAVFLPACTDKITTGCVLDYIVSPVQSSGIAFTNDKGEEIARCSLKTSFTKPHGCVIDNGHTLDELIAVILKVLDEAKR